MEISRSRRYNVPLGLLLIDIDRFKSFNDRFGHLLGDEVLKAVARTIRSNTRDVDVVARYGGEEFCVILQEIGGEEIGAYAERVRVAVATVRVEVPGDARQGVTVSIGAAVEPGRGPGRARVHPARGCGALPREGCRARQGLRLGRGRRGRGCGAPGKSHLT